ncbi:MAG TPA: hypothetical protein VFK78_00105 [Gemmatimonadales bacterium]|nr:hypothetical protein [Gemmatimonadales bacterium]
MHRTVKLLAPVLLLASLACYHAVINTGLAPSPQTIQKDWASGWLWGLVSPSPVSTMAQCPGGVSKVETQHSFLNGLVYWLTSGIYAPMTITVTCAAGHASIPAGAARLEARRSDLQQTLDSAVALSDHIQGPVFIKF